MDIKKVKELLKRARKEHNDDCLLCAVKDTAIDQALSLLDEPVCKTCGATECVHNYPLPNGEYCMLCPKCQQSQSSGSYLYDPKDINELQAVVKAAQKQPLEFQLTKRGEAIKWLNDNYMLAGNAERELKRILGDDFKEIVK